MRINKINHDMWLEPGKHVHKGEVVESRHVPVPFIRCSIGQKVKIFGIKPTWDVFIYLAGCNFKCRGCSILYRGKIGRPLSADYVVDIFTLVCEYAYKELSDVTVTGGEPTLDSNYLIELVSRLKDLKVRVGLYTNGYLLERNLIQELESVQLDLLKLDVKALDPEIHYRYTGRDSSSVLKAVELLNNSNLNFYIVTVLIPNFVDVYEIEKIAKFLSSINDGIKYLIKPFSPNVARSKVSRAPTPKEMSSALSVAQKYLKNVEAQGITHTFKYERTLTAYDATSNDIIKHLKEVEKRFKLIEPYKKTEYISFEELIH